MVGVVGAGVVLERVDSVRSADRSDRAPEQVAEVDEQIAGRFRAARQALKGAGVAFQTETAFGSPAEEILRIAAADGYEMIVIGRRGSGLTKAFLGSVSGKVVHDSKCPVTVA